MDLEILAALSQRDRWDRYSRFVKPSSLTEEAARIFEAMDVWYKGNPNSDNISWVGFAAWMTVGYFAKLDKHKLAALKVLANRLAEIDTNGASVAPLLEALAKRDYASQIADLGLRIADGDSKASLNDIQVLLEKYDKDRGKVDSMATAFGEFSPDDMNLASGDGIEWRMDALMTGAGPIRKGDMIALVKRPDSGGTTFLASEATFMAPQLEDHQHVLWFNNEEAGRKVRSRIVQAATGWHTDDMLSDFHGAFAEYVDIMHGNKDKIKVYDSPRIHIRDVEAACKRHDPGLIVFDQLWKFKGFEGDNEVQRLTNLANWAREIAKEYAPVIFVHQGGENAENQKWVTMDMMYGNKTGMQGEADLIIGLGRKHNEGDRRGIYLSKNKMLTPGDRTKINGKFNVEIDPNHARFIG